MRESMPIVQQVILSSCAREASVIRNGRQRIILRRPGTISVVIHAIPSLFSASLSPVLAPLAYT